MSNNENNEIRDSFTSKTGFILACIGSAVGMGNIWLFPYRVGQFGGAAFLIPYIIFIVLLGYTGLMGEFAFGRMTQTGPIGSFKKALETRNKSWGGFRNNTSYRCIWNSSWICSRSWMVFKIFRRIYNRKCNECSR